jgi:tight adherence protein B
VNLLQRLTKSDPQRELSETFPDELDALAAALSAGSSLPQAIQAASLDNESPWAAVWRSVVTDLRLGASIQQALQHLEVNVSMPVMKTFVCLVSILLQTGGNLVGTLRQLAETSRQEQRFHQRVKSMTAQGRLSGHVVSAMPLLLIVVLSVISPDFMRPLIKSPVGWALLMTILILLIIGNLLIQRLVKIDV